tara:strand:- start:104 stop:520 length:417 start_codon:yes stop_codon:yes gene_type:complete
MLFYILWLLAFVIVVLGVVKSLHRYDEGGGLFIILFGIIFSIIPIGSWLSQHLNIKEYQVRVDSLEERLDNFDYPVGALMNADTPVAAIVNSLSHAESKLLAAKESMIKSIKDVDARKLGPMSGVINFVGDYKLQEEK